MNLMTLIRLLSMLTFGWTAVALGAGALGVGVHDVSRSATYFVAAPSLHDAVPSGRPDGPNKMGYQLLDRTTGRIEMLALPEEPAWSLLSVSPWRDQDGSLQAVGRWVCRLDGPDEFCGLGLIRLSDMTVKSRVTLDVLPTGKPCWVPGRPGEILFPAGNGQLYRCRVGDRAGEDSPGESTHDTGKAGESPSHAWAMTWDAQPPGSGIVYLNDPAWSSEPAVRHLVFVSLSMLEYRESQRVITPPRLWWLVMNEEGDAIVAAGPLTQPDFEERPKRPRLERMPNVVIGPGGKIGLVYLTRSAGEKTWRLCSSRLELDPVSARPRIENRGAESSTVAEGLAPASLVVSADGENVYAIDASGRTVKHSLPR